ncbi:hypothetical protein [Streptomyces sp. NPDC093071]|uniref:hypothetical protein n=1 Tax=Streptomyces sp. NPDC093071 TaxID=3366022 RepID=UPI003818410B
MARVRKAVVIATALVAGLGPVALGGASAFAAPAPVPATAPAAAPAAVAEVGTVEQEGGRLTVPAGEEGPVTLRLKVSLPAGVTGPVKARVELPITNWPPGGWTDHRTAAQIDSTCAIDGGVPARCDWVGTSFTDEPGPYRVLLDLPATEAATTLTYAVTIDLPETLGWIGSLDAPVTLKDAAGTVVAEGKAGLDVVPGRPASWNRGAVHARDKAGVLWRYEGTADPARPLAEPKRVGGGWDVYSAVVPVDTTRASGHGDLVARDKAGVLWYYKGTGDPAAPFAPRVRVGAGWNAYTALVGRSGDLVARDGAGVLWFYRATGKVTAPFAPPVRVGGGWNAYDRLTSLGLDGALARDTDGVLWKYDPRPLAGSSDNQPYYPRFRVGGGWNVYTAVVGTTDLGRDRTSDLVARDKEGKLWLYQGVAGENVAPGPARTLVGNGWNAYDLLF